MKRKRNRTRERATVGGGKTARWRMRKKKKNRRRGFFFRIENVAFTKWRFRENVRKNGSKKKRRSTRELGR